MKFSFGLTSLTLAVISVVTAAEPCCTDNFANCMDSEWCNYNEDQCGQCQATWATVAEQGSCTGRYQGCDNSASCCGGGALSCVDASGNGWKSCEIAACTTDFEQFLPKETWCGQEESNCDSCGGVWTGMLDGKPIDPYPGCCTNDFKDCIAKAEWCGRTPTKCGSCGGNWVDEIQEGCTTLYQACDMADKETPNYGCCTGSLCLESTPDSNWFNCAM